jgi:aminopeptidase N
MLRKYVGDEAFFASLHYYLKSHAYESVEVHDLRLDFEKITGEDLNWFFNQWFLASVHPQLRVRHTYEQDSLKLEVWQLQDPDSTPIYRLPLFVDIWVNDQRQHHAINITKENEVFTFPVSQQPNSILFDSESQLLAEVIHLKSDQELTYQYYHSEQFAPRFEAIAHFSEYDSLGENLQIIKDALNDSFWVIRQLAVNTIGELAETQSTEIIDKLQMLSTDDPKSLVRADAITALATLDPINHQETFTRGLADSSYAVVGASIMACAQTDAINKTELFEPYAEYKNFNIVISLSDFYVESQTPGKYAWFLEKLTQVDNQTLYYLLNYFGRYLLFQDMDTQGRGTAVLAKNAQYHPTYYVRLTAYRTMGFFSELPGVAQRRAEIRNEEKEERLQLFYQTNP